MSTTLCGVCAAQPSRYKCPTCQLAYCSLSCYKPHKATHASDSSTPAPAPPPVAQTTIASTTSSAPTAPPPPSYPPKQGFPPSFAALPTSASLAALLSADPSLKAKLHAIYNATLPGGTEDDTETVAHFTRGGFRGRYGRGRGRGGHDRRNLQRGPWNQGRADDNAVKMIAEQRERGGEGGMAEFVRVAGRVCAGGNEHGGVEDGPGKSIEA